MTTTTIAVPRDVPDGYALVKHEAIEYLADQWPGAYQKFYAIAVDSAPSAPTVKAEQAPTPEFVWVRLLEALAGDNGCPFTASTDDYREAEPALVQLIAAGLFRDDADSLDGDIWTIAAGEQSEAAARFASCADAYAVLYNVLNRVFERPDEAPSLPAAGSADLAGAIEIARRNLSNAIEDVEDGKTVAALPALREVAHFLARAALSAQQSAPERVGVPVELAARLQRFCQRPHSSRDEADALDMELRALLASHGRGEANG